MTSPSPPDFLDRQKRIPGWDQDLISSQVVMCMGAGGLGTAVLMALVRLGVKLVHVIDFDTVEPHNLNRQILFNKESIGKSKAESSCENAEAQHNLITKIIPHHFDITQHWPTFVSLSKECTVIFNMVDVGDDLDILVQSLALTLKIPLISGGTFRTLLHVDSYPSLGSPCLLCANPHTDQSIVEKCKPGPNVMELKDLSFIRHDDHPTGASAVFVSVTAAQLMVANWTNLLFYEQELQKKKQHEEKGENFQMSRQVPNNRIILYLDNMDIDKFKVDPEVGCPFCPGKPAPIKIEEPVKAESTAQTFAETEVANIVVDQPSSEIQESS